MSSIVMKLLDEGSFEVADLHGNAIRILNNDDGANKSWVTVKRDWTGVRWEIIDQFPSLDGAMNAAVDDVTNGTIKQYIVELTDGTKFQRPGSKTAEEVMASAGWYYMSELIGFVAHKGEPNVSAIVVRNEVSKRVTSAQVRLGEATHADNEDGFSHWLVDVNLPYGGWLHLDHVDEVASGEFEKLGLDVIPYFDHRKRTNVARSEATILEFPKDRIVRAA